MKNFKILDDLGYRVEAVGTMRDIYEAAGSVRNTYEHIEDYIEKINDCLEYETEYEVKAYNIYDEEDHIGTVKTIEEVEEELTKIYKDLIDVNRFFDKGYNFVMIRKNLEFYRDIDLASLEEDDQDFGEYFDESELCFYVYYNDKLIEKDLDIDQLFEFILKTNYSQSYITERENNIKYELTNSMTSSGGRILYRIKALKDFGDVKAGDLGGYVESEDNLSHEGTCWIYDNAKVYDNAYVSRSATIYDNAKVYNNAVVSDEASVFGHAQVSDDAGVFEKAKVFDSAKVFGCAEVYDTAKVFDSARVFARANIYGSASVFGYAKVYGNGMVCGDAKVFGKAEVFDMNINTGDLHS